MNNNTITQSKYNRISVHFWNILWKAAVMEFL